LVVEGCKSGFFRQTPEFKCCLSGHFILLFLNYGDLFGSEDDSKVRFLAENLYLLSHNFFQCFVNNFFKIKVIFFGPNSVSKAD